MKGKLGFLFFLIGCVVSFDVRGEEEIPSIKGAAKALSSTVLAVGENIVWLEAVLAPVSGQKCELVDRKAPKGTVPIMVNGDDSHRFVQDLVDGKQLFCLVRPYLYNDGGVTKKSGPLKRFKGMCFEKFSGTVDCQKTGPGRWDCGASTGDKSIGVKIIESGAGYSRGGVFSQFQASFLTAAMRKAVLNRLPLAMLGYENFCDGGVFFRRLGDFRNDGLPLSKNLDVETIQKNNK